METQVSVGTPPQVPKPRKSRRLWYLLGGFLLLLIVAPVAFYVLAAWWRDREMEAIYRDLDAKDPNWRWHDLVGEFKPPPDEHNSAIQVQKIQVLLKKTPFWPGPKVDNAVEFQRNARLGPEYEQALMDAFAKLDPNIVMEARKLKDMPEGGFALEAVDNPFFDLKLDYAQESRGVIGILQYDAILRCQAGDADGAIESCRGILNVARSLKGQPFLISQLVRIAEQAIAVAEIERALGQGDTFTDANLQKLQDLLEMEIADDTLHQAMRGERAAGHQIYVLMGQGKISFTELTGNMGLRSGIAERFVDLFPGVILSGYPDYLKMMSEQVRASKLKDVERADAMAGLREKMIQKRNILSNLIMPATTKVADASQRTQASLRCAQVAVALERYRLKREDWPSSLDALVKAGFLKEVPVDPYDAKPLRFKKTPTGVIVYSVGMNKVDDNGKLHRNPMTPNTDIGLELWEPRLRGVAPAAEEEGKK